MIVLLIAVIFLFLLVFDLPPFKAKHYPDYNVDWEYGVFETSNGDYLIQERRTEKDKKTNEVLFRSGWQFLERHKTKVSAYNSYDAKIERLNETINRVL